MKVFNKPVAFVAILILVFPSSAFALMYSVAGWDATISNPTSPYPEKYYWVGTRASNFVMSNPTITYEHQTQFM